MASIPNGRDALLPLEPFNAANACVNELRGRCLDSFTRSETAVTECLVAMAAVAGRGAQIRLPHLVGQRLEALAMAIAADGPFEAEGGRAAAVLERCRQHADFRNMLCHGTSKVTLDAKGRWTVVFRLATLRSKRLVRETLALGEAEAEQLRDEVIQCSRDLCSQLGQVRARLIAPGGAKDKAATAK